MGYYQYRHSNKKYSRACSTTLYFGGLFLYTIYMNICFIGHRKIENSKKLKDKIYEVVYDLIHIGADTFLFGSKSEFDDICLEVVSKFKEQYPNIKRIYVRSSYPVIEDSYKEYLLKFYEESIFPKEVENVGRCAYIKRNQNMIDACEICVFYFNPEYIPPAKIHTKYPLMLHSCERKSGTAIAFKYAKQKNKKIINLFNIETTNATNYHL